MTKNPRRTPNARTAYGVKPSMASTNAPLNFTEASFTETVPLPRLLSVSPTSGGARSTPKRAV